MPARPDICAKRGCYRWPKSLFPEWDQKNVRCEGCPYYPKVWEPVRGDQHEEPMVQYGAPESWEGS